MCTRLVIHCLMVAFLTACARDSGKHLYGGSQSGQQAAAPRVAAAPYEQIGSIEDLSFFGVRLPYTRFIIRIAIPLGYSHEEVSETLRRVAEKTAQEKEASEVRVFAYQSKGDVSGIHNVGRATWKRATNVEPIQLAVDLVPSYFSAAKGSTSPGPRTSSGFTIFRESYGDKWPFPGYADAKLDCETEVFRGTLRPFVTVELGGIRYGFNNTAVEVGGFPDAGPYIRDPEPGNEIDALGEIRIKASGVCAPKLLPRNPPNPGPPADR